MTLDEFCAELRDTPRKWHFNEFDRIRLRSEDSPQQKQSIYDGERPECPIHVVADRLGIPPSISAIKRGDKMGLSSSDAWDIIDAADGFYSGYLENRPTDCLVALRKACGLS
jgi:hypothetical protein